MFYKKAVAIYNENLASDNLGFLKRLENNFLKIINQSSILRHKNDKKIAKTTLKLHSQITPHLFAPIYDSGCCLGREHLDEKVIKMLNDSQMIEAYIRKGESEIHWEGHLKKRKHFELIELLLDNYPTETKKYIERVKKNYNSESIKEIIENIDINVPTDLINFKLSETRKQLMFKLVTLRIEKLIQYL